MKSKIAVWILVLLLAFQLVNALGVRPAKTSIAVDEFEENNIQIEGKLWVVNNENREFTVGIYLDGEMADFVKLKTSEKKLTFTPEDDAKEIEFEIKFKKEDVPPGVSTAYIVIEETLENDNPDVVASKVVLKHKILFQGPYPDKYIEMQVNFHQKGREIELVSEVKNLGKKDIEQLQTTFYVNDKEQEQQEAETETTSLPKKESKLLKTTIAKDNFAEAGEYEVTAVTKYDDQKIELYKSLVIGKPEVEINYFDKYFIANTVNQYTLDLLNKWNKLIPNVYVDVKVLKEGKEIDSFRTKSVDIEGEMIKRISDYLDAKDKGPGLYTFEMTVNYWNLVRMDQRTFTFESNLVTEEDAKKLNLAPPALTGAATGYASGSFGAIAPWVLIGILLGIIGFYLGWRYVIGRQKASDGNNYNNGNKPF